ncbi:MAG TPA: M28 family peptidase [Gemmatimonadales bacterium]|nr:M28 family peptidase [Gemmatimonadales bacterium]
MRSLTFVLTLVAGCSEGALPPKQFDGAAALRYIQTQLGFGPRIPGTPGHEHMAAWLDSLLRARADTVLVQRWVHRSAQGDSLRLVNFVARFKPAAPTRLLFLAHWDTRPKADGPHSRDSTLPVPGANDGASGVAVLLGMADALRKVPPEIGVDLLFVDGEDYGNFDTDTDVLLGSRYYAEHLPPGAAPRFAVLFDMVGDQDLRIPQEGLSLTAAPDVVDLVWTLADRLGYGKVFPAEQGIALTDDHVPLQQKGIRAIDLVDFTFGGVENQWHHTPDDTFDKVSSASLQIVGDVGMGVIRMTKE